MSDPKWTLSELPAEEQEVAWNTLVQLKATKHVQAMVRKKQARVCPLCMQVITQKVRPILEHQKWYSDIVAYVYRCPEHGEWRYPYSWAELQIPTRP